MKNFLIILIICAIPGCTYRADRNYDDKEAGTKDKVVYLKTNFVLNNPDLFPFIDLFIERCKAEKTLNDSDIDNNFYMLFIYQNDFFTRIKLSFISPAEDLLKYTSGGLGYFEYKGRVFIIFDGLDRLCYPDSAIQRVLLTKYRDRIENYEGQVHKLRSEPFFQPFTWEADIVGDTIFIKQGTINPFDQPPADTSELFKYMRSLKSFKRI